MMLRLTEMNVIGGKRRCFGLENLSTLGTMMIICIEDIKDRKDT